MTSPTVDEAAAIDAVPRTQAVGANEGVEPVAAADAPTPTDAIAQALAAGEIDAAQARERLIEAAVAAQLPPDVDPAQSAEVRAEVAAMLEGDPTLQRLLTP